MGADVVLLAALGLVVITALAIALLFRSPSSEEIVEAFREERLEVGESHPLEKGGGQSPWVSNQIPGDYEEGMRFEIPPLGEDSVG